MTDKEIEETIKSAKAAIAAKGTKKRAKYSDELKRSVVAAAKQRGLAQFSRDTGLSISLISQWKRGRSGKARIQSATPIMVKNEDINLSNRVLDSLPKNQGDRKGVRELTLKSESSMELNTAKRSGYATVKAGSALIIELPLESLTPTWVAELVTSLESRKGALYV